MENAQFAILAILSAISIALCAYLILKIRNVTYLLEQPVVKKMSPELKLKPVKIDELNDESRRNASRNNNNGSNLNRSPRPAFEGGERPNRDNRDNRDRAPRAEGEGRRDGFDRNGGERGGNADRGGDRGPRNDRGDRGDRFRDRDRGGRHDRHDRGDRNDRGGRDRRPEFATGEAPAENRPAPVEGSAAPAALSPRRPLPSTVEHEVEAKDIPASAESTTAAEDALFARDDSDIQHGRRQQTKKKPRFEVSEEEVKATEETKA